MPISIMNKKKKSKKQKKNQPQTTQDKFFGMMEWVMKDMDKEPQTQGEMMAQSFGVLGKTIIVLMWVYGKTLGFIFRLIKGGLHMIFRKGKNKKQNKNDPSFQTPAVQQQLADAQQLADQLKQHGIAPPQPLQQQLPAQPPHQPVVQVQQLIPAEFPAQPAPSVNAPVPPPVTPAKQQPVQPPAQPLVIPVAPAPPAQMLHQDVNEQLMMSFIKIADNIKITEERLTKIETYAKELEAVIDDIYKRLNMIQGVQPASEKQIKF